MKFPKFIAAAFLSCIGLAMALPAQAALTIDSATWDGKKLKVDGSDGKGGVVEVFYGYDTPANSTPLGIASVKGNGSWRLQINSNRNNPLDPVPCAVSATLDGDPDVLNVTVLGADPNTCAPQPPAANECNISVAPTALAFGDITEGTTSAPQASTVSNSGTADCVVTVTQSGSADFSAAPLAFTVTPGSSQDITVDYTPDAVGPDSGTLAVGSNDPDTSNINVALSGNGVPPQVNECNIAVSPTSIDFGNVQIGTTSAAQTTAVSNSGTVDCTVTVTKTGSADFSAAPLSFTVIPGGSQDITVDYTPDVVGADSGNLAVGSNDPDTPNVDVTLSGNGVDQGGGNPPTANDDNFVVDTAVIDRNGQADVTAPGVLNNDTDPDGDIIEAVPANGATTAGGTYNLIADGSFSYTPPSPTFTGDDSFSYTATDGTADSAAATVTLPVQTGLVVNQGKNKFNIMLNYELGMHCTGFEFAYCCVLPPYNSIIAQVARSDKGANESDFPMLLEGDPVENLDGLLRETVLREPQLADVDAGGNGDANFNKYVLKYWHDAQPRNDGRGKAQSSTLISAAEGNSLFMWNSVFDAAAVTAGNALITGAHEGATNVVLGDGDYTDANDNYANGWLNHFYIYADLEGGNPNDSSAEADKLRLGLENLNAGFPLVLPTDCGPAFHPMGPSTQGGDPNNPVVDNNCGGVASRGNLLTWSTDHGTVVFTQMKVLENLPVMLTSPRIWEALGLPLTPFEDSIDFFGDPGLVDEDSIRPYVAMKAQLHHYDPAAAAGDGVGNPVLDDGNPVIGFGTAPIDIPNCERCHSELQATSQNSAQQIGGRNSDVAVNVEAEIDFWMNFYGLSEAAGDSTWYPRLKGAAISILDIHDRQHGTSFMANWPGDPLDPNNPGFGSDLPQNTRLGGESVICQKCHADSVIAVVKSANCDPANPLCSAPGALIVPITEAIHDNHRNVSDGGIITMADSQGRDGGCQGCHPAHRSDGDMAGYPITIEGDNFYELADNRDANGGCFVGRDVHSNPGKDTDGAETPEHLNSVGQWLQTNVAADGNSVNGGIWCTNCHSQLGQEIWKAENMPSLVHDQAVCSAGPTIGQPCNVDADCDGTVGSCGDIRGRDLQGIADVVAGGNIDQVISWLDPTANDPLGDATHAIWEPDPGLCNYVAGAFGAIPVDWRHDGNVATVEVNVTSAANCSTGDALSDGTGAPVFIDCNAQYPGAPSFYLCGSYDQDPAGANPAAGGDFNVSLLAGVINGEQQSPFCTTGDCVAAASVGLPAGSVAAPVPFSAASDARDHWLSAGEPHCADCHAAPYTEQSGNINAFPPFNYPRKASLMRYSRGHQDITCQGCHESIHGLYPVTPTIDTTSYAQAANLNHDGSHGPVKCGGCHEVDGQGIPTWIDNNPGGTMGSITDFDSAIGWAHTYTDEQSVLDSTCQNCHGVQGNNWSDVAVDNEAYMNHAESGQNKDLPRSMMDKAETELYGAVFGTTDGSDGACQGCHGDESGNVQCVGEFATEWKLHLTEGRVAQSTWETASVSQTGSTCGW